MNNKGNNKKNKSVLKLIFTIFGSLFLCAVIVFVAIVFINYYNQHNGKKNLVSLFTIISPSMVPTINVYDVVVEVGVNKDNELNVGDIITFNNKVINTHGYTITHRIVEKEMIDGIIKYRTKGDSNYDKDNGYITINDIVGKVIFVIPQAGRIQRFLSSKFGWLLFILIPAGIIVINDIVKIVRLLKIKKEIEAVPYVEEIDNLREKEENERLKELLDRANDFNNK